MSSAPAESKDKPFRVTGSAPLVRKDLYDRAVADVVRLSKENERLREGVRAFVSDLCLRAEAFQQQDDHDDAEELWAEAERWEKLLP